MDNNIALNRLQQSQTAKRMNLAEWRISRLTELPLPSGLVVTVRDVGLEDLVFAGVVPNTLMEFMMDADEKQAQGAPDAKTDDETIKAMMRDHPKDFSEMLNELVKASFVAPAVGDVADETHITLAELKVTDKMFVFEFLNREANAMRPFRSEQEQPVAPA